MLPLDNRCKSREMSADGGGATTEGAGILSFGSRVDARSGAETGGGTTASFAICTGALDIWRVTAPGAGGMTLVVKDGVERDWLVATVGAGATTSEPSEGAAAVRSRERCGAGAITLGASEGATSACSLATPGAGGITVALRLGAERNGSRCTDGDGAITLSSCTPLRVTSRMTFGAGATTGVGIVRLARLERIPSEGGGPALGLMASRLATASCDEGSFRSGASTTCCASALPRAILMVWVE